MGQNTYADWRKPYLHHSEVWVSEKKPLPVTLSTGAGAFTVDAFGRHRVSAANMLFDGKCLYDKDPARFAERLTGTATSTHNGSEPTVSMAVNADGDKAERASAWVLPYQAATSQLTFITFNMEDIETDVTKRVGYFDDDDGVFLELRDGGAHITTRSSVSGSAVETSVAQADWNGEALDGSSFSGVIIDWTKIHLLAIDFAWLSAGDVRFFIFIDGVWQHMHTFEAANELAVPYMRMPNLRPKWEIEATAAATGSMKAIATAVIAEGNIRESGSQTGRVRNAVTAVANGVAEQLLALRLRADRDHAYAYLVALSAITASNDDFKWWVVKNPTYTGGSAASWANDEGGLLQYDETADGAWDGPQTDGTNIVLGCGVATAEVGALIQADRAFPMGVDLDGTPDVYALIIEGVGNNVSAIGSLDWVQLV